MASGEPVTGSAIPPGPVPLTATDPLNVPGVVGRNLTRMMQFAPEVRVPPQLAVTPVVTRENGAAPTVMPLMVNVPGPALLRRKSSVGAVALVAGMVTCGNVAAVTAASAIAGAPEEPTNSTAPMSNPPCPIRACGLGVPKKSWPGATPPVALPMAGELAVIA